MIFPQPNGIPLNRGEPRGADERRWPTWKTMAKEAALKSIVSPFCCIGMLPPFRQNTPDFAGSLLLMKIHFHPRFWNQMTGSPLHMGKPQVLTHPHIILSNPPLMECFDVLPTSVKVVPFPHSHQNIWQIHVQPPKIVGKSLKWSPES